MEGFLSKFFSIIKIYLFETVVDSIYRYSLTNNNSSIMEFKEKIDMFMKEAGFHKREIKIGELFDSKICTSEHPEPTVNPALHKTIKDIIWHPYILTYFSTVEDKQVSKIIKGKVICYSSKIQNDI